MITGRWPKCLVSKPIQEFSKNKRKFDGLQTYCKECYKAINADTYKRLPKRRAKIRERNKDWRLENKRYIDRLRRMFRCRICGESEPVALDFHHLDPTKKDANIPRLLCHSRVKLKEEIRKCVVLCANCHRKHHAGITGFKL